MALDLASGLLLGYVLGPLLFVVYPGNLDVSAAGVIGKFAGGVSTGGTVDGEEGSSGYRTIPVGWANLWQPEPNPERNQNLVPCRNCGRSFEADSLARHEPICNKVNKKKKRVFNSYKQRAQGTDLGSVRGSSVGKHMAAPVSHWREQHEDFINTVRNARLTTDAMKKGLPLPPPPPPTVNPDYIECPYCNRRFNETAAERHINFCKTNVSRKIVARQALQPPSASQPKAPSPKAQVQMASKQVPGASRPPAVPSTSQQPPRAPPVHSAPPTRTGPPAYPSPAVKAPQQTAGSPSKGKLTAAAQAVMGIRAGPDDPSAGRVSDARGQPPAQYSRYSRT